MAQRNNDNEWLMADPGRHSESEMGSAKSAPQREQPTYMEQDYSGKVQVDTIAGPLSVPAREPAPYAHGTKELQSAGHNVDTLLGTEGGEGVVNRKKERFEERAHTKVKPYARPEPLVPQELPLRDRFTSLVMKNLRISEAKLRKERRILNEMQVSDLRQKAQSREKEFDPYNIRHPISEWPMDKQALDIFHLMCSRWNKNPLAECFETYRFTEGPRHVYGICLGVVDKYGKYNFAYSRIELSYDDLKDPPVLKKTMQAVERTNAYMPYLALEDLKLEGIIR